MGSGVAKGTPEADILVITHSENFDLTVDSTSSSQISLNSAAREKRRNKMFSAAPITIHLPDVENVNKDTALAGEAAVKKLPDVENVNKETMNEAAVKKQVRRLTEDEVLSKTQEIVPRLKSLDKYNTSECATDLTFLRKYSAHSSDNDRRVRYFNKLTELGITQVFEKVWATHFKDSFTDESESDLWNNMKCILIVMWNGTDRSEKMCQTVLDNQISQSIVKWLQDPKLAPEKTNGTRESYSVKGFFGVIHNTLNYCDARHTFREEGVVKAIIPFLQSPNLMVRTKAIINLAYLITEEEGDLINADDENFLLLKQILESCLEKPDHHSKQYGFWAGEVLEVLNLLAAVDSNKEKIASVGVLPLYSKLLEKGQTSEHSENEQVNAAKGLWTLAFNEKIRKQISEMTPLMTSLTNLANDNGVSASIKRAATGALWVILNKDEKQRVSSAKSKSKRSRSGVGSIDDSHIMISYNWGSKPMMLKVRDRLKAAGFNVWMDVDNMTGSTLEAMAQAVEKASLVIICMTQKYKESPSCRTEAEYTYKLRKTFIPLRLEYKYNPDGWLGIMIGTTLWFDFSVNEKFEASMQGLVKEIKAKGSGQVVKQVVEPIMHMPPTSCTDGVQPTQPPTATSKYSTWAKEDVKKWLNGNNLNDITKKFQDFSGEDMVELKYMLQTAPDFYYGSLRDNFKLPLIHILRFTKVLKEM